MAYLGRKGASAALTSADIPDDSITAAKIVDGAIDFQDEIGFLENKATTQNLSGTYSTERMYLNDSYTLTGDVTITGHLALGTVADSDVVITQDSTERTITGSGTLESGDLLHRGEETLTGMAGWAGMIAPFAMSSAPSGWHICDGTAVSRTTYADLFSAIGTTWGAGNGSSTFNVPDLRGAFLRGTGTHGSSNKADGSSFEGTAVGSFENDQYQGHTHSSGQTIWSGDNASGWYIGGSQLSGDRGTFDLGDSATLENGAPRTGDETMPFNAGIQYCIKY